MRRGLMSIVLLGAAAFLAGCMEPSPGCAPLAQRMDSFGEVTWNETGAYERLVASPDNRWPGNFGNFGLRFVEEPYFSRWGEGYLHLVSLTWNASDLSRPLAFVLSSEGHISAVANPSQEASELRAAFVGFARNATTANASQIEAWFEQFRPASHAHSFNSIGIPAVHHVNVGANESAGDLFGGLAARGEPVVERSLGYRTVRFGEYSFEFHIWVAGLDNPIDQWGALALDPEIGEYSYARSWGNRVTAEEVREGLGDVFAAYDLGTLELADEPIALGGECVKAWR